ncbi:V4R domain-containing protein [Alsobacter sp. R-9]
MSASAFRERLAWTDVRGEILDQTRRYMLIRPEALMGVFRRLPPQARAEALDALEASIFEQGSDSARAYRTMGGEGVELARVVAETAPQLGWGLWRFDVTPDLIRLEVRNSPFAAGFGSSPTPVCHAITGMVRAVSSLVFDRPATAREVACAAAGAPSCLFEATPNDKTMGGPSA